MYRFFVSEKDGEYFKLTKEILEHLKVLRIGKDEIFVCIYQSKFYKCVLEVNQAKILSILDEDHEYANNIVLFASIINIKRFEWLIQKACELGVQKIYPVISKNTNSKYEISFSKKNDRFNEIAKNACEQSFRNIIATVEKPIKFEATFSVLDQNLNWNLFIAHEKENKNKEKPFQGHLAFWVGPEGGFTEEEVKFAQQHGTKVISLGKRILRAETASIYLLSNIEDEL